MLRTPNWADWVDWISSATLDTTIMPAKNSFNWKTISGGPNYRTYLSQIPGEIECSGMLLLYPKAGIEEHFGNYIIEVQDNTSSRIIDAVIDFGIIKAAIAGSAAGVGKVAVRLDAAIEVQAQAGLAIQ
jgi:hypothetical protein